jgi:hypothetical protein
VYDPRAIEAHIRAALRRSGISREAYVARFERFVHAADRILDPRQSIVMLFDGERGVTQSEFYGALWMLLIADVFRDSEAGSGMTNVLSLSDDEVANFRRVVGIIYERYFGVVAPIE